MKPISATSVASSIPQDIFKPFRSIDKVSLCPDMPEHPVLIVRDTASAQSLITKSALPNIEGNKTGEKVILQTQHAVKSKREFPVQPPGVGTTFNKLISEQNLGGAQRFDPTLVKLHQKTVPKNDILHSPAYYYHGNILMRFYKPPKLSDDDTWAEVHQVVLPQIFRTPVYVFVGLTREDLVALTLTHKGRKTEHLVGIVQSERAGEWHVYLNQLYWGLGIRLHATWRKGHFTSPASPFIDKISDIRGSVLKVVTFEWQPSTLYHRTEAGQVDFLYGRDVEVVRALAPVFNFTIKFIEPPNDERWGDRLPNGSWDGIVGMLGRGDAELAIANLFVSALQGRDQYQGYTTFFDTDVSS
ncbi:hypothetical protein O3P69_017608 [Scylla paramamosain]|uniref:Ionotropic glutamate receptor L-glutamate and glycine-binding domain-containing protein n=1 Tax=Scylla paramamosain TaxID=85552 RepID=A0AAW0TWF5_SCYPA